MKAAASLFAASAAAALLASPLPARAQPVGLDPATAARLSAAAETIRQADAYRRSVFLTRGVAAADRYRTLEDFRAKRRKATLDAVEALLAVRGSYPKEEWKSLVAQLSGGGSMPLLVERARGELLAVVPDESRRPAVQKILDGLRDALKENESDRESARKKVLALLEKQSSSWDDFVSALEKFHNAQAKLDDKIVKGTGALEEALTPAEWEELVRRISLPPPGHG